MNRLSLVVALAAGFALATGCKPQFSKKPPEVGTRMQEQQDLKTAMTVTMDMSAMGGKKDTSSVEKSERATLLKEVLAVKDGAPTRMKVTYSAKQLVEKEGAEERKRDSELVGRSFVVELKDGQLAVTDDQGKAVDERVAMQVGTDTSDLGKAHQFVVALPDRKLKVGDEVPELAALIQEEISAGSPPNAPKPQFSNVSVKLRDEEGGVATFAVTVTVGQSQGPMSMQMELTGTFAVRKADSRPVGLSLQGPVTIGTSSQGHGGQFVLEGNGTMSLSRQVTYL